MPSVRVLKRREKKKKTKCGKCHGHFLRAGAFSQERRGIIVFCIVRTFTSTVVFAQFPLCRMLVAVFHCIMVYKQTPPSLHRQHYRAVWYVQPWAHWHGYTVLVTSYLRDSDVFCSIPLKFPWMSAKAAADRLCPFRILPRGFGKFLERWNYATHLRMVQASFRVQSASWDD